MNDSLMLDALHCALSRSMILDPPCVVHRGLGPCIY